MPLAAPVTITILPAIRAIVGLLLCNSIPSDRLISRLPEGH
jgi:hypothetical protein